MNFTELPTNQDGSKEVENNKQADTPTIIENERQIESAVVDLLVEKEVVTKEEAASLSGARLEELLVRTAHDFKQLPQALPQPNKEKARRILGLLPNYGDGVVDSVAREAEIKTLIKEMREYLNIFKQKHPEVTGLILCGSRLDAGKMPAPTSDVDVVLILKSGAETTSDTSAGRELVQKLREFSDHMRTNSGLVVEPDEFYSTDELFTKLASPTDTSKLTWGWNPGAVKYIGDPVNGEDELGVNVAILKELTASTATQQRADAVVGAKKKIADSLR